MRSLINQMEIADYFSRFLFDAICIAIKLKYLSSFRKCKFQATNLTNIYYSVVLFVVIQSHGKPLYLNTK